MSPMGPVAVVDQVADKHGTRTIAESYLNYLYSEEGQELAVAHPYRSCLAFVAIKYATQFPILELFTAEDLFGGWTHALHTHFADDGTFDQMYQLRTQQPR
ncbi:MAG: hypothetical protein ABIR36_10710 [Nitrospiraceae bacterium]